MGGVCMNSPDNSITVKCCGSKKGKHHNETVLNFENFTFYKKIQAENLIYIIDSKDAYLTINTLSPKYSSLKQKWIKKIFSKETKNSVSNKNTVIPKLTHLQSIDHNFKFKDNSQKHIVDLLVQHSKNFKLSFTYLLSNGPPNQFRWLTWLSTSIDHFEFMYINEDEYRKLTEAPLEKEVEVQIRKDLSRSAPHVKFFQKEENRNILYNILKAIAVNDPELSYCQGMNILTAYLILVSDGNEIETFNLLRYIFSMNCNIKLREFYLQGFPRLNMYIFLLKEIIKEKLPEIHEKISSLKVPDELWLFKWLQSLFGIILPFVVVVRLWDCIFSFGIEFILNYSVIYISYNKEKIIQSNDMGDFIDSLKMSFASEKEMFDFREKIILDAKKLSICDSLILKLKSKYEKIELEKLNFSKNEKVSVGLSSTNVSDRKSSNRTHPEGKTIIAKIEENLKFISEVCESVQDGEYDLNQIEFEIIKFDEGVVEERKEKCVDRKI